MVRASELSVRLYLKRAETCHEANQDILLGVVKLNPLFEDGHGESDGTQWLDVDEGTGKMRIGVRYAEDTSEKFQDSEHAYCAGGQLPEMTASRNKETQQLFTRKTIKTELISSTTHQSLRFRIDSPFIAALAFAFQGETGLHLFAPFIAGEPLFYRLQRDRVFDADRSRFYAAELLCAFKHLHKLDIVYLGLTPRNILIDTLGHIIIVDHNLFVPGLENGFQVPSMDAVFSFPAPEVLLGRAHSKSSDWCTLGCILYEMLTGMPPFYNVDSDEFRRNIISGPLCLPASLPASARDILSKLLNREPEQRLGTQGPQEIEDHHFFNGIELGRLERFEYEPTFKPRCVATVFRDRAPSPVPLSELLATFNGFSFPKPETETKTSNKSVVLSESLADSKTLPAKAPSLPDTAAPPHPTTQPCATPDGDDADWKLGWEESRQEFVLRDYRRNTSKPVPSRHEPSSDQRLPLPSQPKKEEALEWALDTGNVQAVHQLLENFGDINLNIQFSRPWETPLVWAAEHQDTILLEGLLSHGADPTFTTKDPRRGRSLPPPRHRDAKHKSRVAPCPPPHPDPRPRHTHPRAGPRRRPERRGYRCRAAGPAARRATLTPRLFHLRELPTKPPACSRRRAPPPQPLARRVRPAAARARRHSRRREHLPLVRLLLAHGADAIAGFHGLDVTLPGQDGGSWHVPPFRVVCGRVAQLAMGLGQREVVRVLLDYGADGGGDLGSRFGGGMCVR